MKSVFSRKNRFRLFKSLVYKNAKAQNMPLVTDRLVGSHLSIIANLHSLATKISRLSWKNTDFLELDIPKTTEYGESKKLSLLRLLFDSD